VGFEEEITFEQVRRHNKPGDAWCAIQGYVYDISKFASAHPGGDIILLAAGKEATVLFETYHARMATPEAILNKYRIGKLPEGCGGSDKESKRNCSGLDSASYYTWNSEFYQVMKERVVQRLKERGVSRRGGMELWLKAVFLLVGFWASLFGMCTLNPGGAAMLCSVSLGMFAAFIGTCIQHDGNHGAFAESHWINKVAGWTLDMIGASAMTWEFQHVLGHHPYTNLIEHDNGLQKVSGNKMNTRTADQESDPDVFSTYPMLRLHPWHTKRWYHKFQHLYAPFIFGFMTINKVVTQDFGVVLRKRLFQIDAECRYSSPAYLARFWTMKALTVIYMVFIPCYLQGFWQGLKLFGIAHFTCGEVLATMFIVNHIIEGVSYASKDSVKGTMAPPKTIHGVTPMDATMKRAADRDEKTPPKQVPLDDWAAVQCQTSVNWSVGSWFWNHFSGGLNHQIEHHLFPGLSHQTYYHIQDVVQSTCEEYGVPYQHEESLISAYFKMLKHLKDLGNDEEVQKAWARQ